jgi:hypothetical protein
MRTVPVLWFVKNPPDNMVETESKGKNINRSIDWQLPVPTVSRERNTGQGGKHVIDRAVMNTGCLLTGERKSVMVQKVNGNESRLDAGWSRC